MVNHPTDAGHLCFISGYMHPPSRRSDLGVISAGTGWFLRTFHPFLWWQSRQVLLKRSWQVRFLLQSAFHLGISGNLLFDSGFNSICQNEHTVLNREKFSEINVGSQKKKKEQTGVKTVANAMNLSKSYFELLWYLWEPGTEKKLPVPRSFYYFSFLVYEIPISVSSKF